MNVTCILPLPHVIANLEALSPLTFIIYPLYELEKLLKYNNLLNKGSVIVFWFEGFLHFFTLIFAVPWLVPDIVLTNLFDGRKGTQIVSNTLLP